MVRVENSALGSADDSFELNSSIAWFADELDLAKRYFIFGELT